MYLPNGLQNPPNIVKKVFYFLGLENFTCMNLHVRHLNGKIGHLLTFQLKVSMAKTSSGLICSEGGVEKKQFKAEAKMNGATNRFWA